MCEWKEEFVDHILLHCAPTSVLWQLIFSLFEIVWVIESSKT